MNHPTQQQPPPPERQDSIRFSVQDFATHHHHHHHHATTNQNQGVFATHYELGEVLGEGAFGQVFLGTHKQTAHQRAIKRMEKGHHANNNNKHQVDYPSQEILREFRFLKALDHPNLIKVYDLFEETIEFFIVTDLYGGGDLFDYLEQQGTVSEAHAKAFMTQLLTCINYLHVNCRMVHRDLKPENILLQDTNRNLIDMKLIDFGLAQQFHATDATTTTTTTTTFTDLVGSTSYIAPQVIDGEYTFKCDLWSCGVMVYTLLAGYTPFDAPDDGQILQAILVGRFDFQDPVWKDISDDAKDFICNLLAYDEEERPTAAQALTHAWLNNNNHNGMTNMERERSIQHSLLGLARFTSKGHKLKQAVCAILAAQFMQLHERKAITEGFRLLDHSLTGCITKEDLQTMFPQATANTVDRILEEVNFSRTGSISYSEYAVAMMFEGRLVKDKLPAVFGFLDHDGDGTLSMEDLQHVLNLDVDACTKMMEPHLKFMEKNGPKGGLSLEDFKTILLTELDEMESSSRYHHESSRRTSTGATTRNKEMTPEQKQEAQERLTIEKKQKGFMWYGRLGHPRRDEMIQKVNQLRSKPGNTCDITEEDVLLLPWAYGGKAMDFKEMNKIQQMQKKWAEDTTSSHERTTGKNARRHTTPVLAQHPKGPSQPESGDESEEEQVGEPQKTTTEPTTSTAEEGKVVHSPRRAQWKALKLSSVLSGSNHQSIITETNLDSVDPDSGEQETVVRTRNVQPRAEGSIFTSANKKKPDFDWVALGSAKLKIASFEERKQIKPAFNWQCLTKTLEEADPADVQKPKFSLRKKRAEENARLANEQKEQRKAEELEQRNAAEAKVQKELEEQARREREMAESEEKARLLAEEKRRQEDKARKASELERKLAEERKQKEEEDRKEKQARLQKEAEEKAEMERARIQTLQEEERARLEEQERLRKEAEELARKARMEEEARAQHEAAEKIRHEEEEKLRREAEEAVEREMLALAEKTAQEKKQQALSEVMMDDSSGGSLKGSSRRNNNNNSASKLHGSITKLNNSMGNLHESVSKLHDSSRKVRSAMAEGSATKAYPPRTKSSPDAKTTSSKPKPMGDGSLRSSRFPKNERRESAPMSDGSRSSRFPKNEKRASTSRGMSGSKTSGSTRRSSTGTEE